MNFKVAAGICLAVVSIFGAEAPKEAGSIDGVWKPVKGEIGGVPMTAEVLNAITLTMKGTNYHVFVATESAHDEGIAKINAGADPKTLDITGTNGPNKGRTLLAIYERDGDKLKVCYDLTGSKRPKEFKAEKGTLLFLVTYERKKDSK